MNPDYGPEFREMFKRRHWVILDTETTGLNNDDQICDIAIIDVNGDVLLNTLVHPTKPIPAGASAIHGISDQTVLSAPLWPQVQRRAIESIGMMDVIVYNAKYDRHMMHASDDAHQLAQVNYKGISTWWCAMEWYAGVWDQVNEYYGSFRWQKLTDAMKQQQLSVADAHRALGDCRMTYALLSHLIK